MSGAPPRLVQEYQTAARVAVAVAILAWSSQTLPGLVGWVRDGLPGNDWHILAHLDLAQPYAAASGFRWSLPAGWLWVGAVVPIGFGAWASLHVAAIATVRPRWVLLLVVASYPFWHDVASGNVLTFCFVAAWWALQGNRAGVVAFCVLAALVPRPLMIPVLAYLLFRERTARLVFPAAAAAVVLAALVAGQLGAWVQMLLFNPYGEVDAAFNLSPTRVFGLGWLLVAWPLAAAAWWRGWVGVSSLLFTPYITPYYALFAFLDLRRRSGDLLGVESAPGEAKGTRPAHFASRRVG